MFFLEKYLNEARNVIDFTNNGGATIEDIFALRSPKTIPLVTQKQEVKIWGQQSSRRDLSDGVLFTENG